MSLISSKQINYIIYILNSELPEVFNQVPKNNKLYPDTRADYRKMILADMIKNYSKVDASTLIDLIFKGEKEKAEQFIFGVNYK